MMPHLKRKTHTLDAAKQPLGRLATRIALLLSGKGQRTYTPNIDSGDFVVVQNIGQVAVTGQKLARKEKYQYSGYPGGLKTIKWGTLFGRNPQKLLRDAVLRMLPKNRLRKNRMGRLTIE